MLHRISVHLHKWEIIRNTNIHVLLILLPQITGWPGEWFVIVDSIHLCIIPLMTISSLLEDMLHLYLHQQMMFNFQLMQLSLLSLPYNLVMYCSLLIGDIVTLFYVSNHNRLRWLLINWWSHACFFVTTSWINFDHSFFHIIP